VSAEEDRAPEGRFEENEYKKAGEFAFCNPAFQAGIDLPPEEAIEHLKKQYAETDNPLFMWEAVRITSMVGIVDADINFFLNWNAFNIVEAARGAIRNRSQNPVRDFAKLLGLTDKQGGTGRLRNFAIGYRDAWICFEMQRNGSEAVKQARHRIAKYLAADGMPLSEGTIERIARRGVKRGISRRSTAET
jgi:hypothetical protein